MDICEPLHHRQENFFYNLTGKLISMELIQKKKEDHKSTDTVVKKEKSCALSKIDNRIDQNIAGVPVDFSFRNVETLQQLHYGTPRQYRVGKPKVGCSKKYISSSIWANYNNLVDLSSVDSLVNMSLDKPEYISWLNVSFNQIQTISSELLSLKNLTILYLHGNRIQFLMEVAKLKHLKRLKTLTLHGNPVEKIPEYRMHIIKLLPQLKNLDFSLVGEWEKSAIKYRRIA